MNYTETHSCSDTLTKWLVVTVILQLADITSTLAGQKLFGHYEANPAMAFLIENSIEAFILVKAIILPFILVVVWGALLSVLTAKRWNLVATTFFVAGNLATLLAVVNNLSLQLK